MSAEDLSDLHIADLHERASEAGVDGYRMLGRDELIERIRSGDDSGDKPKRRRGRRGGRGRGGRDREKLESGGQEQRREGRSDQDARRPAREARKERQRSGDSDEPVETEEVTGIIEITRQRHGFLSIPGEDDDVYVSASQVRRCELVEGDEVTGPARAPRRGERHRALVRVNLVNGEEPVPEPSAKRSTSAKASRFDSLTPAPPARRIELPEDSETLVRAADLLAPLALGQRVLVRSKARSGRTSLLRGLAQALQATDGIELTVVLIDERPEEAAAWKDALPGAELALAPADLSPKEQVKVATKALERARVQAEEGADAVLLCDSLTRLAVAADGLDEIKKLFGSGRELSEEDAGSLTVIATILRDDDDYVGMTERAVQTTESALIVLDQGLAAEGVVPALTFAECSAVGESDLLSAEEMDGLRHLRASLAELEPAEAAAQLRERIDGAATNADVLRALA